MKVLWITLILSLALPDSSRCFEGKYHSTAAFKHPVAQAVFDLGYKLLDEWQNTPGSEDNVVISPESIYSALALILPGLNGDSRVEVEQALGGLHLADIVGEHNEMNKAVFNNEEAQYKLHRANRLYVDHSVLLTKQYKADVFDALLKQNSHKRVNFQQNPNQARERINKYVENHTNGEIVDFLDADQVTTLTRMFLVTALSLQAQWETTFSANRTAEFQVTEDETSPTTFMIAPSASCRLASDEENENYGAVRIPFKDSEMSMLIIMPMEAGNFEAVNQHDVKSILEEVSEETWSEKCKLIIPKFKIATDINKMIPILQKMGISSMFDPNVADLSNMLQKDTEDIHVTDFTHTATVDVNENGIKAAAATGVGYSARVMPKTVLINRPFLFIVRHEATGSSLFLGKVSRP